MLPRIFDRWRQHNPEFARADTVGQTNAEFKSPNWTAEAEIFSAMRRSAEDFPPFRSGRDVLQSPAARGEFSGARLFQDELQLVMRFSWSGVLFPTRNIRLTITR
jgi:hypothetical protein